MITLYRAEKLAVWKNREGREENSQKVIEGKANK